jgi:hypothetical protein
LFSPSSAHILYSKSFILTPHILSRSAGSRLCIPELYNRSIFKDDLFQSDGVRGSKPSCGLRAEKSFAIVSHNSHFSRPDSCVKCSIAYCVYHLSSDAPGSGSVITVSISSEQKSHNSVISLMIGSVAHCGDSAAIAIDRRASLRGAYLMSDHKR